MGQSRDLKQRAPRVGNESKRTKWLWLVPRCGTETGTTSDDQLDEALPAGVNTSAAAVVASSAGTSAVSLPFQSFSLAVVTKKHGEATTPADRHACSIDTEQHDAFQVGGWQIQSTTKAKSEGQVLSSEIFPPLPMSSASVSSRTTRGMHGRSRST